MPYKDDAERNAYQRKWMAARREQWLQAHGPCAWCGKWENLQVDHVNRQTKLSHRVWSWARPRREAELAKCQVLCGDCHRRKSGREAVGWMTGRRKPIQHGTRNGYVHQGCRCDPCRQAKQTYENDWRRRSRTDRLPTLNRKVVGSTPTGGTA